MENKQYFVGIVGDAILCSPYLSECQSFRQRETAEKLLEFLNTTGNTYAIGKRKWVNFIYKLNQTRASN